MAESFRDRWRARPIGNTTAGAIVDATVKAWQSELANPDLNPGRRNRLEWLISEIDNDNVWCVRGLIDATVGINPAR